MAPGEAGQGQGVLGYPNGQLGFPVCKRATRWPFPGYIFYCYEAFRAEKPGHAEHIQRAAVWGALRP